MLVGIGGGVPSFDFTLGDVVCASRVHDFCVRATKHDEPESFRVTGGPMQRSVENILANLPAIARRLEGWNSTREIGQKRPYVRVQVNNLYGDGQWKKETRRSLSHHFPTPSRMRLPIVTARSVATTDALIKSHLPIAQWRKVARDVEAVEMELGGVYRAARRHDHTYPILAIRGISDIVGFRRDEVWTKYACHSAASFAYALVQSGILKKTESPISATKTSKNLDLLRANFGLEGISIGTSRVDAFQKILSRAKRCAYVLGIGMTSISKYALDTLRQRSEHIDLRLIMIDPETLKKDRPFRRMLEEFLGMASFSTEASASFKRLKDFCVEMNSDSDHKHNLELRVYSTIPTASMVLIDPDEPTGEMEIEFFLYRCGEYRPRLRVRNIGSKKSLFHKIKDNFLRLYEDSKEIV
jgi:nucleoside phosphorylase